MSEVCKLCGEGGKICGNCGQRYITTTNDKWIELLKKANEHDQLKRDRAELIKTIKSHGYLFQDLMDNMANTDEVKVAYENIKNDLKKLGEI